jgi:hypothetical protein
MHPVILPNYLSLQSRQSIAVATAGAAGCWLASEPQSIN